MSSVYESIVTGLEEAVKDAESRKADVQEERIEQKAIEFYKLSAGWLEGVIKSGENKLYFDSSYLTNFLEDLYLAILTVVGEWPEDERKHCFRTEEEPLSYEWCFQLENDELEITIDRYEYYESKEIEKNYVFKFPLQKYVEDLIEASEMLLNKYGLIGYREEWGMEFPLALYLKLKNVRDRSITFSTINEEDNKGCEAESSNIKAEIAMLSELMK